MADLTKAVRFETSAVIWKVQHWMLKGFWKVFGRPPSSVTIPHSTYIYVHWLFMSCTRKKNLFGNALDLKNTRLFGCQLLGSCIFMTRLNKIVVPDWGRLLLIKTIHLKPVLWLSVLRRPVYLFLCDGQLLWNIIYICSQLIMLFAVLVFLNLSPIAQMKSPRSL